MSILTILLFFIYTWGLGYTLTRFLKNSDNFLERNLMRIGIGLSVLPFLAVFLSLLRIPLDWRLFLVLSIALPLFDFFKLKKYASLKIKFTKSDIYIAIMLLLFFWTLFMYVSGAFKYPWLEDDDSWHHATGIKFVAFEKTVNAPPNTFMYINPYPPGYDFVFGLLHQTSPSLYWTMKFFNALIVALGIIFFYFFVHKFTGSRNKALLSTFILAAIPSYLSHFIWAHSLVVTSFFVAMYCIEMLKDDKKWFYAGALVIAGMCLTQPTKMIKFGIFFAIYFIVKWISSKKFNLTLLGTIIGGYVLSVIWWINKFTSILPQAGKEAAVESSGSFISKIFAFIQKTFPPNSGSATRSYSWQEIIFAKPENMINNPIGIGIAISILIIIGLIAAAINYKKLVSKEKDYLLVSILWSFTAFMILNSMTFNLPFGLYSFRWWALFAFSASMLAAEGILLLFDFCKAFRVPKILILVIVILAVFFTSASQKYAVNTAVWPFGIGWTSSDEVRGYAWLKDNLPINTKIFAFSENNFVIGFDMYTCMWCKDITENRESSFNYTPSELNSWLKSKGYEYLIFDGRTVRKYSSNETNTKIQELLSSKLFNPVRSEPAMLLFKII